MEDGTRPAALRRVPPNNLRAEESVLGAMLLSREAIADVVEILEPDHFYKPAHGHIFDAVMSLYSAGEPVDAVTVADELKRAGLLEEVGGPAVLLDFQATTPAISNASHYAKLVEEHALLRRLIYVSNEIAEMAYGVPEDVPKAVDDAEARMFDVAQRRVTNTTAAIRDLLPANLDRIEMLYDRGESITGLSTGYIDLDEKLAGLQPSALYVVGARPAMGKTAFALGIAVNSAMKDNRPVLIFTLEMSQLELSQRLLCSEALVDSGRVKTGRLEEAEWTRISHAVGRLAETPIFIDDNPHTSVMDIRAKARRLKSREGDLGMVIVDYVQLMTGRASAESRQVEVSEISRNLKILARELDAPVIALAQLNRGLEQRTDKRPMLSDLRESGCLPASTRLMRADNGQEITMGELVLSQEQPMVWSVDDRQRLVPARLTKAFPSGIKPVHRLRLASGRHVDASANHPFLTINGWSRLDELSPGAFVATPRVVHDPVSAGVPAWSDDELALLAHLLGDGTIGRSSVKYATAETANRDFVTGAAERLFGIEATASRNGRTWQVWLPAPYRLTHGKYHPVRDWLEPHGLWGSRSWDKFVPETVFSLPADKLALFLHHLWATDGSITMSRNGRGPIVRTYYASTSERLALDVQRLLQRLGVRSSIGSARKKRSSGDSYRQGYSVRIQEAANQTEFLRRVGCYGERGDCIPEALTVLAGITENPNNDLVPWPVAYRVKAALAGSGVTHRDRATHLGEAYGGSYLLGSESRPRRFSRDRLKRIGEKAESVELADIATSDLHWDEVTSIELLGDQPTFDVTVEDTHNFIADGIVVHNSLEQDADVVMFLYRDEVYDDDSPDKGVAEVIVAKHRNGPTGKARLAFRGQYTRFDNMARSVPPGGGSDQGGGFPGGGSGTDF